jgi:hypothetical membrane protein
MDEAARTRALLACGTVGPPLFIAAFTADGATRPGYDALQHYVSSLSLGARGWLQVVNFLVLGVLLVFANVGWRRALGAGRASRVGPWALALAGVGLALAGAFATDPALGYPPGVPRPASPSLHAFLHSLASLVVFASLSVACFALARRFGAEGLAGWRAASLAVGVLMPVLIVVSSLMGAPGAADPFAGLPRGLIQRASIVLGWGWIAAVSWRLRTPLAGHTVTSRSMAQT